MAPSKDASRSNRYGIGKVDPMARSDNAPRAQPELWPQRGLGNRLRYRVDHVGTEDLCVSPDVYPISPSKEIKVANANVVAYFDLPCFPEQVQMADADLVGDTATCNHERRESDADPPSDLVATKLTIDRIL